MSEVTVFDAGAFDEAAAKAALRRDGVFLVRNLLTAEEVDKARRQLLSRLRTGGRRISLGRTQPNAAILAPEIDWLVAHPKIVMVFKRILGEQVVFTGHCDIHMNMLSGWHKDSGEHIGGYFKGDYFTADDCQVYKAAIYLQDPTSRDGLTASLGSHRRKDHGGEKIQVPARAGDVVFFDVRLSHTGQLPDLVENAIKALTRLRKRPDRADPTWATGLKNLYWKLVSRRDRLSIFFTYGKMNEFTVDFAKANMLRQHVQTSVEASGLPESLVTLLETQNVRVIA